MDLSLLLSYILWNVDSDIFVIPYLDHPVRWYGVSWALGFILSQQVMYYIYKRDGQPAQEVDTLTIYMIIAAVVGARLGHVLFYDLSEFSSDPIRIFAIWEGGLASHGAAIGILIGLFFFARNTKINYLWITDRFVIVSALAGGLIRVGNLMNSEMVGLPTTLPWGFVFTSIDDVPRHPAQLYEAIYCFLLFLFLFRRWHKAGKELREGFLTGWFFIILFSLRFVDEFFKINQVSFEDDLTLNMGQILSIPFVILGIVILLRIKRQIPDRNDLQSEIDGAPKAEQA
jgi:phosphatidylglycerol---prolipoprotein diacylglyceryl transferase